MNAVAQFRPNTELLFDPEILTAAFEACPEPLAVFADEHLVHGNAALAQMLGAADDSSLVGETLAELRSRRAGAGPRFQFSTTPFSMGGRDFLLLTARPPTPLPVRNVELRRSQNLEAMGRLVSGVAHDFNNLLTGVLLCCDLLLAKLPGKSPLRRYAEEMKTAGNQGATLIQQLQSVLRQDQIEPELPTWNQVVAGMWELLARLIGENIELATDLAGDLGHVPLEAAEAQQIVLNLVLNARDAMPDGGRILLATRNCLTPSSAGFPEKPYADGWIEFEVTDTGCGMTEDVRASMFQLFFTTKKAGQGNGVGLATVKSIVDRYRGTIQVVSAPGKGTQIKIGFPVANAQDLRHSSLPKGSIL